MSFAPFAIGLLLAAEAASPHQSAPPFVQAPSTAQIPAPATGQPPPPTWYPPYPAPAPWWSPPSPLPPPTLPGQASPAAFPPPPPPRSPTPTPGESDSSPAIEAQPKAEPSLSPARASWSLQVESAQGVGTGRFQNTLLAARMDYAFASPLSLGGSLAIANLKGKDRRVNALLPCAVVTYERPPGRDGSVSLPIQFATGYLTRNGPVARVSTGLAWAVGERTDLILSLAAMAWVTRDQMLLSVNLGLEIRFRAGG